MTEIVNAKIDWTMLGNEDHGLFTCQLGLDYGGVHQGFGGYSLDQYIKEQDARKDIVGAGTEFIKQILWVVGVDKWEDLKGKVVRVERKEGWNGNVIGIGNVLEDKWFKPKEWFKRNYPND